MISRRGIVCVGLGAGLIAASLFIAHRRSWLRSEAVRIPQTTLVTADGHRLADLFDDLPRGPRFAGVAAIGVQERRLGAIRRRSEGFLARLVGLVETRVYGAALLDSCSTFTCTGDYELCTSQPCPAPACSGSIVHCTSGLGANLWQGAEGLTTHGCSSSPGYDCNEGTADCNEQYCDNGQGCVSGGCPLGKYCDTSTRQCEDSWCTAYGPSYYCRSDMDCQNQGFPGSPCDSQGCCGPPLICTEPYKHSEMCNGSVVCAANCNDGTDCKTSCSQPCGSVCIDCFQCNPPLVYGGCNGGPICQGTPIVLDPFDEGFHLTDLAGGVNFRDVPDGPLRQMVWTDPAWQNGWLALDRNADGVIGDLSELFGSMTPQPSSNDPNGFRALAVFDDRANGGNNDGFIDAGDTVYSRLRVWIDANHNGVSEPAELRTLPELGILKIGLRYQVVPFVDQYGNRLRYRGTVWDETGRGHDRCYDVFLSIAMNPIR